jgi:ABC-type spermidine/putrescine transport system permease subunit II
MFLAPGLIHFMIFTVFAVAFAFYISFHEWNIIRPEKPFVGVENYTRLIQDTRFHRSVINTFTFMVGVPLNLISGLAVALLLNTKVRGQALFRTMFYIPVVTPLVVSSIIWKWLYQGDYGLLNYYLLRFGIIQEKIFWLADPNLALPALILMGIWGGTGATMVIYLAGLQSIPEEMYDAAKVDGANSASDSQYHPPAPADHIFPLHHRYHWRLPDLHGSLYHDERRTLKSDLDDRILSLRQCIPGIGYGLCNGHGVCFVRNDLRLHLDPVEVYAWRR